MAITKFVPPILEKEWVEHKDPSTGIISQIEVWVQKPQPYEVVLNGPVDYDYNRLVANIIIQIQMPFWDKNPSYELLCNVLPIDDFVYFVKFCKDKPWDYIRTICNHYYDCNQYVFCVSYRELMELFPYESLEDTTKIEEICRRVMEEQPQSVVDFKKGKKNSINRLKGQVMKITNGKVNINIVDSTLVRLLSV